MCLDSRVGNSRRSVGQDRLYKLKTDQRDMLVGPVDQLDFQSDTKLANIVP